MDSSISRFPQPSFYSVANCAVNGISVTGCIGAKTVQRFVGVRFNRSVRHAGALGHGKQPQNLGGWLCVNQRFDMRHVLLVSCQENQRPKDLDLLQSF